MALGQAVSLLARRIEQTTNSDWRESPFAFEALQRAVHELLLGYAPATWTPDGPHDIPESIQKRWPEQTDPDAHLKV